MKVIELLDIMYKRNKSGELSHFAKKLLIKHNISENDDISEIKATIIASEISNKEKRIAVIESILSNIENNVEIITPIDIRNNTYKTVCKFYHPDNVNSTGNAEMFRFVQEVKEYLWNSKGVPRKEIRNTSWDYENQLDKMTEEEKEEHFNFF